MTLALTVPNGLMMMMMMTSDDEPAACYWARELLKAVQRGVPLSCFSVSNNTTQSHSCPHTLVDPLHDDDAAAAVGGGDGVV